MNIGMLWFDNDKASDLPAKVARAAAHYRQKYGRSAELCFVHPAALEGVDLTVAGVKVAGSKTVLPGHFWIGVKE